METVFPRDFRLCRADNLTIILCLKTFFKSSLLVIIFFKLHNQIYVVRNLTPVGYEDNFAVIIVTALIPRIDVTNPTGYLSVCFFPKLCGGRKRMTFPEQKRSSLESRVYQEQDSLLECSKQAPPTKSPDPYMKIFAS